MQLDEKILKRCQKLLAAPRTVPELMTKLKLSQRSVYRYIDRAVESTSGDLIRRRNKGATAFQLVVPLSATDEAPIGAPEPSPEQNKALS